MGLYNFMPQFRDPIKRGTKTHTIRAPRAHPDKPGNMLHLYLGLRTRSVELIMRVPCVKVEDILIRELRGISSDSTDRFEVAIDGVGLEADEKEALARRDGFENFNEMMKFWNGRVPFTGHIIHWKHPKPHCPGCYDFESCSGNLSLDSKNHCAGCVLDDDQCPGITSAPPCLRGEDSVLQEAHG